LAGERRCDILIEATGLFATVYSTANDQAKMSYETADIRKFLTEAFDDEELGDFCFDYFSDVQNRFSSDMSKGRKIQLLIEHCQRRELIWDLRAALSRERPDQYKKRFQEADSEVRHIFLKQEHYPTKQVFISHAYEDAFFAHSLAAALRKQSWPVWIAPDSIQPGEKWVEAINRGLNESSVFVLVLTPHAVKSDWVNSETNAAIELEHQRKLQLVPTEFAHCSIPPLWNLYQRVSFLGRYEDGLATLFAILEKINVKSND
jgi:sulfatase modifying factor 1